MRALILATGLSMAALAAHAEDMTQISYDCERGVQVDATYINVEGASFAVVQAEGRQLALQIAQSGSGAKYSVPEGETGAIWWTKGDTAMLSWFDADLSEEVTLYRDCTAHD